MRTIFLGLVMSLLASNALATTEGHDKVYLVVKNMESNEFFVERAPIIGCYGLAKGPQLVQFTAEYKVSSNIGCGGQTFQDNINYLTCAKVLDSKESRDYKSFSEITLDISKCDEKHNPKLITMIRAAAKLNFPLSKGEVKLNIIR